MRMQAVLLMPLLVYFFLSSACLKTRTVNAQSACELTKSKYTQPGVLKRTAELKELVLKQAVFARKVTKDVKILQRHPLTTSQW